jgi:hypothetical protein
MSLQSSLHAYQLVHARAVRLLGIPIAWLLLTPGKVYDTPGLSGRYVIDLARSEDGSGELVNLLDKLEAGASVPILLYDDYVANGDFPTLQIVDGQLYSVRLGKRQAVRFL